MAKAKILIIDDDTTVGNAISEAFKRAGFETIVETDGLGALGILRVEKIDGVVIDCMIPGINGVDLALKIRKELNFQKSIVLISGIFKDSKFAQNSIKKTSANDFMFKPLDLEKLISSFKNDMNINIAGAENWIDKVISRDYIERTIELRFSKSDILAFLGLLQAESASVVFEILNYKFNLINGSIVDVNGPSKYEFIKEELLKKKYTNVQTVNKFIDNQTEICQQIIEKSIISPHLLMNLQGLYFNSVISKILFEEEFSAVNINLGPGKDSFYEKELVLQNENFIYEDYLKNKFDFDKETYVNNIINFDFKLNSNFNSQPDFFELPIVRNNPDFVDAFSATSSCRELFDQNENEELLKVFYLLNIKGYIQFNQAQISEVEMANMQKRLGSILKGVEGKDPAQVFKFLGVSNIRPIFVSTFFKSFAKANHPDRIPQTAPAELIELNQKVFSIVSEAHGILTDPKKKEEFDNQIKDKQSEKMLMAESYKEKGQSFLSRSKYKEALENFKKARDKYDEPVLLLYYYWCYFKVNKRIDDKKKLLSIYNELIEFEIDDKRNELYTLVMGIFFKRSKKYDDAIEEFEKSLGYNKNFLPARRELMNLKSQLEKHRKNNGDLSSVVSGLFKKKA